MTSSIKLGEFCVDFHHRGLFRFFSCSEIFSPESYALLQQEFVSLPWEKKVSDFYSQYSAILTPSDDNAFSMLFHSSFFLPFKAKIEKQLGIKLRNNISIVAHKLTYSQEIGVHNDFCDPELGYESHRFVFQFARKEESVSGGELTFLASPDKKDVIKQYSHSCNKGICFEVNQHSFHFVAPVEQERYTLVMYLWETHRKYDGSGIEVQI